MDPLNMGIGPYGIGGMQTSAATTPELMGMSGGMYGGMYGTGIAMPEIGTQAEMLSMPIFEQYRNQVDNLDQYNNILNNSTGNVQNPWAIQQNANTDFDYTKYYELMAKQQELMMQNAQRQQEQYRLNNAKMQAPINKVNEAASDLHMKIAQNEQDQIQGAFQAYLTAYKSAYDPNNELSDEDLKANALQQYRQTVGVDLKADIINTGHGSFTSGFINGATFGLFGDKNSAEENISQITKQPVSTTSRNWKTAGKTVGGALTGAAVGAAALGWTVVGAPIGALAGAIIGGVASFFT